MVSLPAEDVRAAGLPSRSAALQHAVRMLRRSDLDADDEAAWAEWETSGDAQAWDVTAADAIADATR